jgi:hypothetical protein
MGNAREVAERFTGTGDRTSLARTAPLGGLTAFGPAAFFWTTGLVLAAAAFFGFALTVDERDGADRLPALDFDLALVAGALLLLFGAATRREGLRGAGFFAAMPGPSVYRKREIIHTRPHGGIRHHDGK